MIPGVKMFVLRAGLLGMPCWISLATYVIRDPFMVLRHYEFGNYYDEAAPVELNRDYVSLQLFRRFYPTEHYDSFIFGSSRSFPFRCRDWERHLADGHAFAYPAAAENLYGIVKKLEYFEKSGVRIKNALLEVTTGLAGAEPRWDAMHRLPYELTGESWLDFQATFLKAYFSDFYFLKYMLYTTTGKRAAFAKTALGIERGQVRIEPRTNDYIFASNERELSQDGSAYYARRSAVFGPRAPSPPCASPAIGLAQQAILDEIRAIFDRQRTRYRIVLMPIFDQVCLDPGDRRKLDATFGRDNVFDFTGVNELTEDEHNFYDGGHVRVEVASRILDVVYGGAARPADR